METWRLALAIFLLVIVGIVSGYMLGKTMSLYRSHPSANKKECAAGTMIVNTTDPKKDVIRFELDVAIETMIESDRVIFKVKKEEAESQ